ncbi:hypothetical protein [Desulfonatronovibrio magnus]|uniref:hypothetical protein n=1 Tax=Desulfonatronovibrio magnus TaxID=698827 RepID=UPI0005EBE2FC|nr:hypothetical protein [Desulfonatronovibrio magnus]
MSMDIIISRSVFLLVLVCSSAAFAWELPEKVWVKHSMPPTYWMQSGGILQQSGCSLQRYDLFRAGGAPKNIFRMAVICPIEKKFCVMVLPDNQQVSTLPVDCVRTLPESSVHMAVSSFLYTSGDKKQTY